MTSLINSKRIDSLTFEEQIALATAASKEESAPASKEANASQEKALETAQKAAEKQKQLLKETEKDKAPAPVPAAPTSTSAPTSTTSTTSPAPASAAASSSTKKEEEIPPLKPTTNEAWVKHKISSPARLAMRVARPVLLRIYDGSIPEQAQKRIRAIDLGKIETLGDAEKEMLPLIEMCEPRKEMHAVIQEQAKACFDVYVQKGVMAAIDFAKEQKK